VNRELEQGVHPEEIIYTSFTRAACNEAVQRALTTGEMGYKKDDFPYFRTEHAICFRLLGLKKEYVFAGKNQQDFSDKYPMYRLNLNSNYSFQERTHEAMLQSLGDYYEFFISWMDNLMMPFPAAIKLFIREQRGELPEEFTISGAQTYMERRDAFKQEHSFWDFNDMIHTVSERRLCPDVKILLCDEAQDMSPSLYRLIDMWASQAEKVYIAGDKFQAIYGFSGAAPELFDEFPGEMVVLPHSHRLPPQIKDYAEKIIALANLPFPQFTAADKVGEIQNRQMATIDWLNLGPTFLLARTRWQLKQLADRLRLVGVPFTFAERLPYAAASSSRGLEGSKGEAFRTLIKIQARERVSADDLRALAKHTRQPWLVKGAKTRIKELVDAEYAFKDVAHFFSQNFLDTVAEDLSVILCQDIDEGDKSYLHRVYKKCGVAAFMKKPDIVLSTIHGSKGQEKETVVISPEMGRRVYESFLTDKKSEVFVAYVAATRSMKRIIMLPRETPESFPYPRQNGVKE